MFDQHDYISEFEENASQQSVMGRVRSLDSWLRAAITFSAIVVALYTSIHGVSATLHYRAHGAIGTVTGIAGIVVLELLFLVLSHGLIHGTFKGNYMHVGLMWAASGVSLVFIILNTIIDSQLNANAALADNLAFYFQYIMPVASVVVVVLALIGQYFAPDAERARVRSASLNEYEAQRFAAYIATKRAEMSVEKMIANAQLGARVKAAKLVAAYYNSDDVQKQVEQAALGSVPMLLEQIGVKPAQPQKQEPEPQEQTTNEDTHPDFFIQTGTGRVSMNGNGHGGL